MATPSASSAIELLRSHSLTTLVRRELERRILVGELAPGDKLNEADLASELKVSRGPVREAFRALDQAGLVRTEKNRGVFVRQVSVEEADEIYEVRAGLDEMIGRLAAERATAEEVGELREMVKRMQQVARGKDVAAYYPLNVRFHDRLADVSGNRTLAATYRRLVNELHLHRRETLARGPDSFPISTREHAAIVEAISRGDAELAGQLLREHAMESRDRLHATIAKKGQVTK
ncbi:phosphonate utilization associated transcriptional regulator [Betaproteobacteria bacterium GR16-43]|nr:phosphonate utilization associated transcriptional regulator [Betaproteobacteria bacterium GR16-43]